MASPLTFLRPFRHEAVHSVLLLQSAPIDLTLRVAERLRTLFPHCTIELVVREDDREAAATDFARVMVVRWEDRLQIVRELRRRRYDAVVVPTSHRGSDYLRALPILLRTRAILVFNDHLDYFPLHVARLRTLVHHLSGGDGGLAIVRWAVARPLRTVIATARLVASVIRLELRAAGRRLRS
jgi:hypothetical protein